MIHYLVVALGLWTGVGIAVYALRSKLEFLFERSFYALFLFLVLTLPLAMIGLLGLFTLDKVQAMSRFERQA